MIKNVVTFIEVSITAVSNYLIYTTLVNLDTARRIQKAVERLDYKQNQSARSLQSSA